MNSNAFGYRMLLGTIALAYLWMVPSRFRTLMKGLIIACMAFFALGVLASGSRQGILGLVLFYIAWVWFCYRKEMLHRPSIFLGAVFGLTLGGLVFGTLLSKSAGGERLLSTYKMLSGEQTKGGGETRITLYKAAWAAVAAHPFVGIGPSGFLARVSGKLMTHSEYMEVATMSGLPGAVMYFSITVALWLRTSWILRHTDDPLVVRITRLVRATIAVLLLSALFRCNYYSKEYWVVMASFIGYTHAVWLDIKARVLYPSPGDETETYAPVSYA
jgi:O-antigen ligase